MTDKKEEYHSGGAKVFMKKKYRQGGCEGSNGTVCQHGNVKPSAEGCVFHLTKKYAAAIQK